MWATTVTGWLRNTFSPDFGRTTSKETLAIPPIMKARTPTANMITINSSAGAAQSQKSLRRFPCGAGLNAAKSSGGKLGGREPSTKIGSIGSGKTGGATSACGRFRGGRGSGFEGLATVSGSGESASGLNSGSGVDEISGNRLPSVMI